MVFSLRASALALCLAVPVLAARPRVVALKTLVGQPGGPSLVPGMPAPQHFVVGRDMRVAYTVFNVGDAPALDVSLDDDW